MAAAWQQLSCHPTSDGVWNDFLKTTINQWQQCQQARRWQ